MTSCSKTTGPTTPSLPVSSSEVLALTMVCPDSLLIGEARPCTAVARLRSGQTPLVSPVATWSWAPPDVVAVDRFGLVSGRSAGQAVVSASYGAREAQATVRVLAEDGLRVDSGQGQQGEFTPGSTVTMWLQGYYSVASADTGRLSLRITDQLGTVTTTPPVTKTKGGAFFLMSSTFVVPQDSIEVCRTAILEVGAVRIAEPQSKSNPLWCIPIRR